MPSKCTTCGRRGGGVVLGLHEVRAQTRRELGALHGARLLALHGVHQRAVTFGHEALHTFFVRGAHEPQ
jgi:hypothetical protein